MISNSSAAKPSVHIYVTLHAGYERKLREVQAGLEEEGIPYVVAVGSEPDTTAMAYEGACVSQLGVGVGIGESSLCLHYHKLPQQQPLFTVAAAVGPAKCRQFGYNAARLVKGIPFKEVTENQQMSPDNELISLVRRVIAKVLKETAQDHEEVKAWSKTP